MLKAFKYRLDPNKEQTVLLNKHVGSARFIYNLALECKQMAYSGSQTNLTCFDLIKQLPDLKKECEWLKEINSQSLQQAIGNLDKAYTAFFKGHSKFPKFKKKINGGSFNIPQNVALEGNKLCIPKFQNGIKVVLHLPIKGTIRQATISKTPTGKYFVSVLCETGEPKKQKAVISEGTSIGIDLGIKTFVVTSNGETFDNPKFLKNAQSRLKFVQRKHSKHKGNRTRLKLAKLHEKVANQRKDFLHKVSSKLVNDHDTVCIETLKVSNMLKNHCLAQAISDVGWGMFTTMLEYKADWQGKNILKIGTFEPSSKTCSCCGAVNKELKLKDREWECGNCGAVLDRDLNAAINIKIIALNKTLSGTDRENQGKLPTLVGALTLEARPSSYAVGG